MRMCTENLKLIPAIGSEIYALEKLHEIDPFLREPTLHIPQCMHTYTLASLFVTNCSLNISGLGPFSSSNSCTPDFTAASSLT